MKLDISEPWDSLLINKSRYNKKVNRYEQTTQRIKDNYRRKANDARMMDEDSSIQKIIDNDYYEKENYESEY